jgi:hypothetical protein
MKSSSKAGPRRPALSECWLSATGTAWLVVSVWPVQSARTLSSGKVPGLRPRLGSPRPTFLEATSSVTVLAPTIGFGASAVTPGRGLIEALPYSAGLFALDGIAAASACVPAIFSASESAGSPSLWAGPLTVEWALDAEAEALCDSADRVAVFPDADFLLAIMLDFRRVDALTRLRRRCKLRAIAETASAARRVLSRTCSAHRTPARCAAPCMNESDSKTNRILPLSLCKLQLRTAQPILSTRQRLGCRCHAPLVRGRGVL